MPKSLFILPAMAVALLRPAAGQELDLADPNPPPDTHMSQVYRNGSKIKLEVALDRQDYLSGEVVLARFGAFNPDTKPVEVFDPLAAARFEILKWSDRFNSGAENWEPLDGRLIDALNMDWNAPTVTLGPGQRVERQVAFSDRACPQCISLRPAGNPPAADGRYRLRYCFPQRFDACAETEFTVAVPTVVASAHVKRAEPLRVTNKRTGQEKQYTRYFNALILESSGRRYVGVSRVHRGDFDVEPGPTGKLDAGVLALVEPYDRVAEVGHSVKAINLVADDRGNLTVTWTDEAGRPQAHYLSADRSSIEPTQAPALEPGR
ncbi:MAG TPA: hypothetical protein VN893_07570 [Bryobacteraceae bacterium]|nr:hypothetical protein [Bryobacteraceae bacterium]